MGATFPTQVFLPEDGVVLLRLKNRKVTSRHKPGHRVVFEVEQDVLSGDSTYIARGTPVHAVVGPWTRTAPGVLGTGRLEIQFEDVPLAAGRRAALQPIRVIGRTLGEVLSWVSRAYPGPEGEAVMVIGLAALGHLAGEVAARATFKTDEVKFRKGDLIRVNTCASRLPPCGVQLTSGSHRTARPGVAPSAPGPPSRPSLRRPDSAEDDDPGPPKLRRHGSADRPRPATTPPYLPPAEYKPRLPVAQTDPLIERVRWEAFEYSSKLPNFICRRVMTRMDRQGLMSGWQALDVVEAELVYENSREIYRNIKIDNKPVNREMNQIEGSWSMGEFASMLIGIFVPASQATFRLSRHSRAAGASAAVYDFQIEQRNSDWKVVYAKETITPAYKGSVWIHEETASALRVEIEAFNLPPDFSLDTVEMTVDYGYVRISGREYLLPVESESLACWRGTNQCARNKIQFRNYRKFSAESTIVTTDSTITFEGKKESNNLK